MQGRGCHAGWCFRWRCFSRVHAIAHVYILLPVALEMVRVRVTFLLHNVAIFSSCMFQVLTGPRVWSLLFHVSVFYWHTCRVAVGSRVTSSLDHVSYFYWSTCLFLIWPCIMVLSVHVTYFYTSMWRDDFLPSVKFLIAYITCHALDGPRVVFLLDHMACGSTTCRTNYIRKVIQDRHYCTNWLHTINISHVSSKPLTEYHHNKPTHESTQQTTNIYCIKLQELKTES
jgi:hypothetical protein